MNNIRRQLLEPWFDDTGEEIEFDDMRQVAADEIARLETELADAKAQRDEFQNRLKYIQQSAERSGASADVS